MREPDLHLQGRFDTGTTGHQIRELTIGVAADPRVGLVHITFDRPIDNIWLPGQDCGDLAVKLIKQLDPKSMVKIAMYLAELARQRQINARIVVPDFELRQ